MGIIAGDHPETVTWSHVDDFNEYTFLTDESGNILTDELGNRIYISMVSGEDEGSVSAGDHPDSATWSPGDML